MALRPIAAPTFPASKTFPIPEPEAARGSLARIWLVRHAEVHADWQSKAYGNFDVPLSEEGAAATTALGSAFASEPVAHVQSSDLERALAMGRAIANSTGAPLVTDERLREIWRGTWQGLTTEEFRVRWAADADAFFDDPWNWKGHGGESDADVFARAWPATIAALDAAKGQVAVVTTHYNVIRVLVTRALGWTPRESFAFRNSPAHATLLVDTCDGWQLLAANVDRPQASTWR